MNLSLRNRVAATFIIGNILVLVLGFTVYFYLDSLNKDIEKLAVKSNRITLLTDEVRISAVSILKYQRRILLNPTDAHLSERLINLCDGFTSQLQSLDAHYKEVDVKKIISKMLGYVDSLRLVLNKAQLFSRDNIGLSTIGDLADKILEAFSEFQDLQYIRSEERNKMTKKVINETKKHMMITLVITFIATVLLGLVIPTNIALPFKKIMDAIRELQECNFDVSIYYNKDDEIGEIAREMNRMIQSFKTFEELRTHRISMEVRKFDALANIVKKYVLVANAKMELIYLNNPLYSLLQIESDDVLYKRIVDTRIPDSIKETYRLAIKRRSKIENAEIKIPYKVISLESEEQTIIEEIPSDKDGKAKKEVAKSQEKSKEPTEEAPKEEKMLFKGYAHVIPIRGKESSLDYYLMVMSEDVIV